MIDPIARRVAIFLEDNSISIKAFAASLGVQRSSLSHILSGRNKPSLDFILKMLQAYPTLSERWLLLGKGLPQSATPADNTEVQELPPSKPNSNVTDVTNHPEASNVTLVTSNPRPLNETLPNENQSVIPNPHPVKLLLLYSDGSFRQYNAAAIN
jgi:plasmid maintenance system antidote protein VapI